MKLNLAVELMERFAACLNCGSEMIGAGAGAVEVTEDTFRRSCKCGFEVNVSISKGSSGGNKPLPSLQGEHHRNMYR